MSRAGLGELELGFQSWLLQYDFGQYTMTLFFTWKIK